MNSGLDLESVLTFDRLLSKRLLKMSMKTHRCSSMLSVGATLCLAASAMEKSQHGYQEILSIRIIDAFLDLFLQPVDVSSETLEGIERFLVVVYSRTCSANGVWKELLAHGSRIMKNIPPTKAALLQHV